MMIDLVTGNNDSNANVDGTTNNSNKEKNDKCDDGMIMNIMIRMENNHENYKVVDGNVDQ